MHFGIDWKMCGLWIARYLAAHGSTFTHILTLTELFDRNISNRFSAYNTTSSLFLCREDALWSQEERSRCKWKFSSTRFHRKPAKLIHSGKAQTLFHSHHLAHEFRLKSGLSLFWRRKTPTPADFVLNGNVTLASDVKNLTVSSAGESELFYSFQEWKLMSNVYSSKT